VIITGFADLQEPDPINLSLQRAAEAKNHLVGKGWSPNNITIKAAGATDIFDKVNLPPNRRVLIEADLTGN
jgi:outer membrane protein OmpA-like peptidoglycan-associated protein